MASLEPPVWPLGPLMGYGTLAKLSPNKRSRPGLSPAYTFAAAPFVQDPLGGTNGRVCRAGDALRAIEADGVASNGLWAAGQVFHSFHREVKQAAFEKEEARVRLAAAEAAASVAKDSARRASELTEELTAAHQVSEARREQLVSLKSQVEEQEAAAKRCEALNLRLEELQREVGTADMEAEKLTSQLSDALKEKAVAAAELDDLKGRLAELMKAQAASDIEREELVGRLEAQRLQVDALNEKRAELGEARNQLAVMEQRLDAACTEACVLAEKVGWPMAVFLCTCHTLLPFGRN